ncbi:RNA polymerase sigma-70 factor [Alistipes sp. OttesenSCG-928-B03]|nr:RNA polymerase sigma-70 factor [Alistipes sp. OttesenSCG-928-B03]
MDISEETLRGISSADNTVVQALCGGDHRAYDKIFLKYYESSLAFVRSLVKREEDAEDIVTDVFVGLWANRERLDPTKNFNAYLYSVVRNAVFNYFRTNKVRNNYVNSFPGNDPGLSADEEFIARETELLINLTVGRMPDQRKRVFELHQREGKSNAEIAELLGISRKAVEKHLRLALSDIRKVVMAFMTFIYL